MIFKRSMTNSWKLLKFCNLNDYKTTFEKYLLKVYKKDQYNIFFENLVSAGYLPKISLPTRITDHNATLIENIFGTELIIMSPA